MNQIEKNIQIFLNEQIQNNQSFIMIRNDSFCINIGNYTINNLIQALFLYENKQILIKMDISILKFLKNETAKFIIINPY